MSTCCFASTLDHSTIITLQCHADAYRKRHHLYYEEPLTLAESVYVVLTAYLENIAAQANAISITSSTLHSSTQSDKTAHT
jgi:hypothetical protein